MSPCHAEAFGLRTGITLVAETMSSNSVCISTWSFKGLGSVALVKPFSLVIVSGASISALILRGSRSFLAEDVATPTFLIKSSSVAPLRLSSHDTVLAGKTNKRESLYSSKADCRQHALASVWLPYWLPSHFHPLWQDTTFHWQTDRSCHLQSSNTAVLEMDIA